MLTPYQSLFELVEILGKKWTAPLLVFLFTCEKTTFSAIKRNLKITSRALSKRLKALEMLGLVEKKDSKKSKRAYYILSQDGKRISETLMSFVKPEDYS